MNSIPSASFTFSSSSFVYLLSLNQVSVIIEKCKFFSRNISTRESILLDRERAFERAKLKSLYFLDNKLKSVEWFKSSSSSVAVLFSFSFVLVVNKSSSSCSLSFCICSTSSLSISPQLS